MMKNNLKILRVTHNLTQEDLAQKLGVTRQTILAVEKNKYMPSLELAFKLAKLFKCSIEEVFLYE